MKQILEQELTNIEDRFLLLDNMVMLSDRDESYILEYEYLRGKRDVLIYLLDKCNHQECSYDEHEYYHDDADEFYSDPLEDYYSDLAMYKHEEISDMYNKHYHFSWWIGKNVLHTDSMWFTSDEIEAFRVIWQRRISAV